MESDECHKRGTNKIVWMFSEGRKNFLLDDYGGQWHGADLELWDRCRYLTPYPLTEVLLEGWCLCIQLATRQMVEISDLTSSSPTPSHAHGLLSVEEICP